MPPKTANRRRKPCAAGKVRNPATGRCVSQTSRALAFTGYYNGGVSLDGLLSRGVRRQRPATARQKLSAMHDSDSLVVRAVQNRNARLREAEVEVARLRRELAQAESFFYATVDKYEAQLADLRRQLAAK